MASLNKMQVIGNLGNDPETKYTQSGQAVTNISVATTEKWKDKDGNPQERTEWHRIVFWGKLAEIAGEYLRKGSSVYVEGKLQTEKWTDQGGVERYTTKIIASEMQMLGSRPADGGGQQRQAGGSGSQQGGGFGSPREQRQGTQEPSQRQRPQQSPPPMDDFADDDIPF